MNAASLIASFATGTYTVTRRGAVTLERGRAIPATPTTLEVVASVQPATGRDLLLLPEGDRATETRVLFTNTPLLVGGQGEANEPDTVAIDGRDWEVQTVASWQGSTAGDAYYRCVVQAVQS